MVLNMWARVEPQSLNFRENLNFKRGSEFFSSDPLCLYREGDTTGTFLFAAFKNLLNLLWTLFCFRSRCRTKAGDKGYSSLS